MYIIKTDYFSIPVDRVSLQKEENKIIAYRHNNPVLDIVCMHEQTLEVHEMTEIMYTLFVDYINNTPNHLVEMNKFSFKTGIIFYELLQTVIHK